MPKMPSFRKAVAAIADPLEAEIMNERIRQIHESRQFDDDKHHESGSKRVANRSKTMRVGEILFDNGRTASCVVRDLSKTGMRLTLTEAIKLPPMFRLRAPTLNFEGEVTLVWQDGEEFGVTFF